MSESWLEWMEPNRLGSVFLLIAGNKWPLLHFPWVIASLWTIARKRNKKCSHDLPTLSL
jgi:hypothetical protein